jgi:hypothetical protein
MMDVQASLQHITYNSVSVKMIHFEENFPTLGGLYTSDKPIHWNSVLLEKPVFRQFEKNIFCILWNMTVHYRFRNRLPAVHITNHKNTVPMLSLYFFKTHYNISLQLSTRL